MSMTEEKKLYSADQLFEMEKLYKHETNKIISYGRLKDKMLLKFDKDKRICVIEKANHEPAPFRIL